MTTDTLERQESNLLTPEMKIAQAAIDLPEIQAIAQTLAKYNLGIFMPHMHDEETGDFIELPQGINAVEDGMKVSFHSEDELAASGKEFVDVGWQWLDHGISPRMSCTQKCTKQGTQHTNDNHN